MTKTIEEIVKGVCDNYSQAYEMMSMSDFTGTVECRSVAHDIRRNIYDSIINELAKLEIKIGPKTSEQVFRANHIKNLSDMQKVMDCVEAVLPDLPPREETVKIVTRN